ncbi:MAG: hypothetical protein GY719_32505 [bacterium]|nr:hypothetical protein [bacterium]
MYYRQTRTLLPGPAVPRLLAAVSLIVAGALWTACDSSPTEPCAGPMHVGGNVTKPVKVSTVQPQYTEEARRARIQGVVIIQAIIDCILQPDGQLPSAMTGGASSR